MNMNTMEATEELHDWEVLQSSSDTETVPVNSIDFVDSLGEIDSTSLIRANYFSVDALDRYGEDLGYNNSAESYNPSRVYPGLEENLTEFLSKETAEFLSDSGSERYEGRAFKHLEGSNVMGSADDESVDVGFDSVGEIVGQKVEKMENLGNLCSDSRELEAIENISDTVENPDLGLGGDVVLRYHSKEEKHENEVIGKGRELSDGNEIKSSGGIEKSYVVWWRMPLELLKYCVFKMSPAWTISAAAAVLGFLILRRSLYKMKKKTRGMEIKVTFDAKKESQVMSRAARLNEAFWVVKRVPVIRPSLPADGVTTWPAMANLR